MEVKDRGHSMNEPNKYNRVNVLKRKLREKSLALLKQGIGRQRTEALDTRNIIYRFWVSL